MCVCVCVCVQRADEAQRQREEERKKPSWRRVWDNWRNGLVEGHIWLSPAARQKPNSFSSVQRLTVLLSIVFGGLTVSAMFYGQFAASATSVLFVGFVGMCIVTPVEIISVALFRRASLERQAEEEQDAVVKMDRMYAGGELQEHEDGLQVNPLAMDANSFATDAHLASSVLMELELGSETAVVELGAVPSLSGALDAMAIINTNISVNALSTPDVNVADAAVSREARDSGTPVDSSRCCCPVGSGSRTLSSKPPSGIASSRTAKKRSSRRWRVAAFLFNVAFLTVSTFLCIAYGLKFDIVHVDPTLVRRSGPCLL